MVTDERLHGPHDTTPDPRDEREFRTALVRMLRWHGWRVTFNQPSRPGRRAGRAYITTGSPGFPDLTALRPPNLVFLECKMVGNSADPEQRVWLNGLAEVGGNVRAWTVDVGDWPALVALAHDGIEGVERSSGPDETESG